MSAILHAVKFLLKQDYKIRTTTDTFINSEHKQMTDHRRHLEALLAD